MEYVNRYKWILVLVFIPISYGIISLAFPPGNGFSRIQIAQAQSDNELQAVGKLILDYMRVHEGKAPVHLRDVLSNDDLSFQSSNNRVLDSYVLNPALEYSLPSNMESKVIVFEKPGLWSDQSIGVCYANLKVRRLTPKEFRALALMPGN